MTGELPILLSLIAMADFVCYKRNPTPRRETTQGILERVLKLAPELVPEEMRKDKAKPTVEDILPLIVEEGCGLRPGRKGGLRLEADRVQVPHSDRTIPVVYNYG